MQKYKIQFINDSYRRFYSVHKSEINTASNECLENGNLMFGEQMEKFEKNFAEFCKKKYCVSVRSGTDAINLAINTVENTHDILSFFK